MLRSLFGATSLSGMLRGGLEEASATHRAISDRVANALEASSTVDFAGTLAERQARQRSIEAQLQQDMAELADVQIRYESDARLLQEAYARLRTAIRDHA